MKSKRALFQFAFTAAGVVFGGLPSAAQTPPVITGPGGASSAAFWYLGGVTPSCCTGLVNKYWTVHQLTLTPNTSSPSPSVQWFTDSPTKVQITPVGITGATLKSLGRSNPGSTFDIRVWVTVNAVSSAQFPVFINTPWTQSHFGPSPAYTCATLIDANFPNGWVGLVVNEVRDLAGNILTPIDARETFENTRDLMFNNWTSAPSQEATWPAVTHWTDNYFQDTYGLCWSALGPPTPLTFPWSFTGGTSIFSNTQKYWLGSMNRFQGKCTQRMAVTWFTNHNSLSNIITPIAADGLCAPGQFAN